MSDQKKHHSTIDKILTLISIDTTVVFTESSASSILKLKML